MLQTVVGLTLALGLLAAGPAAAQHGPGAAAAGSTGSLAVGHGPKATGESHEVHVNWWNIRPGPGEGQPFLATLFNFLVLGLLLGRFAYPPLCEYVKGRHDAMSAEITEARRLRAEAQARLAEYEARLGQIDRDIAALLGAIRADAEAERARIIGAAEEQAARLRREAELTLAQDVKRLRSEIEREAAVAAIVTAQRILRERMTETDQRNLVERFLDNLKQTPPVPGTTTEGSPRGTA
jgi:F-type H+-transporting ATPase subunit b